MNDHNDKLQTTDDVPNTDRVSVHQIVRLITGAYVQAQWNAQVRQRRIGVICHDHAFGQALWTEEAWAEASGRGVKSAVVFRPDGTSFQWGDKGDVVYELPTN